jgi:hypothetical protein
MKLMSVREAQKHLSATLKDTEEEMIGLTDEKGNVIGLLFTEEGLDEVLVQTPEFREMMARSRASLEKGALISADDLLAQLNK